MLEGREKAQRIVSKLRRLDVSGVYELLYWAPKGLEERVSKAYALSEYARIMSAHDLDRASEIAREALRTLPGDRPEDADEIVREILAQSLRILSVDAYKKGDKDASKEFLERLIEALRGTKRDDLKAFLERAKAYYARLFGGKYSGEELLKLDLKDPRVLVHSSMAALVAEDYELLEELLRRGLLLGTLSSVGKELEPALAALYEKRRHSQKAQAVLAFFLEKPQEFESEIARFARSRQNRELRDMIKEKYRGTALEALALLQEAREEPSKAVTLLKRLKEIELSEDFRRIVEAEAHLLLGLSVLESDPRKAFEEATKALNVDNLDLLVAAYRLALDAALRLDTSLALRIIDEAYERLKDFRNHEAVSRFLRVIRGLKPMLLYEQKEKAKAFLEALKSMKGKRK